MENFILLIESNVCNMFSIPKRKKFLHDMLRGSTNAKSDILSQMKGTIIDTSTIHKHGKSFLRSCRTFYFGYYFWLIQFE